MNTLSVDTQVPAEQKRSYAVFIVGIISLITLWIPPLPYQFSATDFPKWWMDLGTALYIFKKTDIWHLRIDYIVFPLLFSYAIWVTAKSNIDFKTAGLTGENFKEASKCLFLPTFIGSLILVIIGFFFFKLEFPIGFWKRLIPIPAFFQQVAIQLFFQRQLFPWFGKTRTTAWVLTAFFVALHAPNPGLMFGTLFGMYFWARCYQKWPNMYALSISHAFLSALLMQLMPKYILPSVSVGYRFIEKGIANHWWNWN